jgi:DNA repair exonuclease SbcCD ATPase subunit
MQRDTLRQEMNSLLAEYRGKQSIVEQQIQEIDKLNIVINALEKDMLELKNRYERAVEERNTTGVQLIDRNDELCILYERSNQQQQTLKSGELELLKKNEELRLLRLQAEELKRQYLAARRRVPEIDDNRSKIRELEERLERARRETDDCSNQLEDPKNTERWRPLDGDDPSLDELSVKVQFLEQRLNTKREQLLERELVLEEVTKLSNDLRSAAISRRDSAKILVDQLNEFQTKIRDVTKKMLASVSELSMYQATALRLQQEKATRESALETAAWRAGHGAAPTEEAVKELGRTERARQLRTLAASQREEQKRLQLSSSIGAVKTSAEPRPSAYIPESIGIPRPYGTHAPFKPSEAGTTMRHIRAPQPKQIEI